MLIEEFLKNVKISENVLDHLKETEINFLNYLKMLTAHSQSAVDWFLYDYLLNEFVSSDKIENKLYNKDLLTIYEENLLGPQILDIEHIKLINKIARSDDIIMTENEFKDFAKKNNIDKTYQDYLKSINDNKPGEYRKSVVWLGNPGEGIDYAFHIPPEPNEIENYMNNFITYFNNQNLFNPFVKSALAHMIFIKIHPFSDGNGRTARIIMNHYVKQGYEDIFNMQFKYPPINISSSLNLSRIEYFKRQNNVIFKNDVDNNEAINRWLNFILTMYDEQIYYLQNKIQDNERVFYKIDNDLVFPKTK